MALFNFDATTVEPQKPRAYGPLPAGDYEMIVARSDIKPTNAGTGHYIELEMHVVSGEHSGRRLWERLNVDNPNKTAEDIAKQALSALQIAVNVPNMRDTEELHDKRFIASVAIDRKDPERNRIMGYTSARGAVTAKPAPVKAVPTAKAAGRPW